MERIAKRLPETPPVIELDVTDTEHLSGLADRVREHVDGIDGVLHSIGNAPGTALGGNFLNTTWDDVSKAVHVSTFSYKALAMAALPLMPAGGAIVGLTFDATVAWPVYDWMGIAKAGPGVGEPLPRQLPRSAEDSLQPGVGRPAAHDGGQVDPGIREVRRRLAAARAARLGPHRRGSDRDGVSVP